MLLSQLQTELQQILSSITGNDTKGRKIHVSVGRDNNLKPSSSTEAGSGETCISPGFVKFWYNRQDEICSTADRVLLSSIEPRSLIGSLANTLKKRADGTYEGDEYVVLKRKQWRAFFTVRAVRCGSVDLLQKLCFALDYENPNLDIHPCVGVPEITDIFSLSEISEGLEWQNQAEATLSVDYSHSTIIKPKCRPVARCVTAVLLDRQKNKEAENVDC